MRPTSCKSSGCWIWPCCCLPRVHCPCIGTVHLRPRYSAVTRHCVLPSFAVAEPTSAVLRLHTATCRHHLDVVAMAALRHAVPSHSHNSKRTGLAKATAGASRAQPSRRCRRHPIKDPIRGEAAPDTCHYRAPITVGFRRGDAARGAPHPRCAHGCARCGGGGGRRCACVRGGRGWGRR